MDFLAKKFPICKVPRATKTKKAAKEKICSFKQTTRAAKSAGRARKTKQFLAKKNNFHSTSDVTFPREAAARFGIKYSKTIIDTKCRKVKHRMAENMARNFCCKNCIMTSTREQQQLFIATNVQILHHRLSIATAFQVVFIQPDQSYKKIGARSSETHSHSIERH